MAPAEEDDTAVLARSEALQIQRIATQLSVNGTSTPTIAFIDSGVLITLGPESFVNRLFATRGHLDDHDLDLSIEFFERSGVPPSIQIANPTVRTEQRLRAAGFELDWERVLCKLTRSVDPPATEYSFVRVDEAGVDAWLEVLAHGNEITGTDARAASDGFARAAHSANDSVEWLALCGDTPVGCGSLLSVETVAWLGGAATLPRWRRRGVQSALLAHRLAHAEAQGFETVAATALAASGSARNLVRSGFDVVTTQRVYTRR